MASKDSNKQNVTPARWVNRNGIPVFKNDQDLERLFAHMVPEDLSVNGEDGSGDTAGKATPRPVIRDRHGLPFLDKDQQLSDVFKVSENEDKTSPQEVEIFSELLEFSLKGKNQDSSALHSLVRIQPAQQVCYFPTFLKQFGYCLQSIDCRITEGYPSLLMQPNMFC